MMLPIIIHLQIIPDQLLSSLLIFMCFTVSLSRDIQLIKPTLLPKRFWWLRGHIWRTWRLSLWWANKSVHEKMFVKCVMVGGLGMQEWYICVNAFHMQLQYWVQCLYLLYVWLIDTDKMISVSNMGVSHVMLVFVCLLSGFAVQWLKRMPCLKAWWPFFSPT